MFQNFLEANSIDCNFSSSIRILCVRRSIHLSIYIFIILTPVDALLNEIPESREQYMGITCMHLWRREYLTCRHHLHTKYPIDSESLYGFSLIQPQSNVNCELILHDYECTEMTLDETRPSMFTENKWEYLLPQLEFNGLLGVPLNVFCWESSLPPCIIGVFTKNHVDYFFSNYYVRLVFKIVNDEVSSELSDLFIDDSACLKGV